MKNTLRYKKLIGLGLLVAMGVAIGVGCGGGGAGISSIGMLPGLDSNTRDLINLGGKGVEYVALDDPKRQDEIGQAVGVAISNRYPLSTDQRINDYVNLVGLTVASVSPDPELNFCFGVLETPQVGAYSAPGGYVFITRGALNMCQDESELAGVLAHEVAHVALHHGIDAVKQAKLVDLGVTAVKTRSEEIARFGQLTDAAADAILVKGYNRDQETKADTAAVKYLIAAGYDPAGLTRFLQRMQGATGAGRGLGQLMSTHPGTADRVSAVNRQVTSSRATGATLKARFVTNVK